MAHCRISEQSIAPEDGRYYRPKHVEPIEIVNKKILLHLVCCLYYCMNERAVRQTSNTVMDRTVEYHAYSIIHLTFWFRNYFLILAHPVYKM